MRSKRPVYVCASTNIKFEAGIIVAQGVSMSMRIKLMLASLPTMMLPYHIEFIVAVLIVTAIMCTAIDLAKERFGPTHVARWIG